MNIRKFAVLFAALMLPVSAWAVPFSASYTIDSHTSGSGLLIRTLEHAQNPFLFELEENESHKFGLFRIWTDENNVGWDDRVSKPISISFDFSRPSVISGNVTGETDGIGVFFQAGKVRWDAPLELTYGSLNDGLFHVELFNEEFNQGSWFGIREGERNSSLIEAKITLIRAASVPEPGTLALLGLGLVALGVSRRRS